MKITEIHTVHSLQHEQSNIPEWPEQFNFLQDVPHTHLLLKKGESVFSEGEGCGRLGFLISGIIKVFKESQTGKSMTLYRIGRGESCILSMSCALSNPIHQASAIVEEDAWAISLSPDAFRNLMATSQQARDYVFSQFAERLTDNMMLIEEVVFKRMDERVIDFLLQKHRYCADTIKMTHEESATELGTAREVVSRLLKEFESLGLLQLSRGQITIINPKGLSSRRGS